MTLTDLQRALAQRGFSPGPADGIDGPATRRAVMAFQRAHGLAVDGIAGPATRAALLAPGGSEKAVTAPDGSGLPDLQILHLLRMSPRANLVWVTALVSGWAEVCRLGELSTATRARHFLAQTAEETGGFVRFQEDLHNYSAARLVEVWPSRFRSLAAAAPYARNAPKLAEFVYGSRADLGNTKPGDGWTYHGMGPIQATGRGWAERLTRELGIDFVARPDRMLEPETGWRASAAIWKLIGANGLADRGDLLGETRRLNGGLTNLAERRRYLERAEQIPIRPALRNA